MDDSRDRARRLVSGVCAARVANVERPIFSSDYVGAAFDRVLSIKPNTVMEPEFPSIEDDNMVSPHAREVEYALILSQMINIAKEDPSQMRLAIYEFARARLKTATSWADEAERERLSASLEKAIQGVEQFSARSDEKERLQLSTASAHRALGSSPVEAAPTSMVPVHLVRSAPDGIPTRKEAYWRPEAQPVIEVQMRGQVSRLARFSIGILLFGLGLAVYTERTSLLGAGENLLSAIVLTPPKPVAPPLISEPAQTPVAADLTTAAASSSAPPFPLPSDYGVYAVSNAGLSELQTLPELVPDKRVAMSTPINQLSRTTLPDGKTKFVVFRRDLAGDALDRIEVRVVARVMRAVTFDAKGKPNFSPVSDAWNIRNLSYEFRVRPIAGNPEMFLVQPKDSDFTLPAGRYVLALKNQGYDFTVAGKVTDPSQCLERIDAANGSFYSVCQKQ